MILQIICAFIATLGFGILFNVRDKNLLFASLGGALGWLVYLISMNMNNSVMMSTFIASLIISIYAEIFSRVLKNPVTMFLICALIPLAPGSGMYYTILAAVQGDIMQSLNKGIETLSVAGLIALGIITVSTLSRLIQRINFIRHNKLSKVNR